MHGTPGNSLEIAIFFDELKKNIEKKYMFKMCFRTHRIQKIYLEITFFFPCFLVRAKSGVILDGEKSDEF